MNKFIDKMIAFKVYYRYSYHVDCITLITVPIKKINISYAIVKPIGKWYISKKFNNKLVVNKVFSN